jgi:hypothetical protein
MVNIPVAIGELFDKISILEIKKEKINNPIKQKNINLELSSLLKIADDIDKSQIKFFIEKLYKINLQLWDIEDKIRIKEKQMIFDDEFIFLARNVYKKNDIRSDIKKQINIIMTSEIIEEKSYEE